MRAVVINNLPWLPVLAQFDRQRKTTPNANLPICRFWTRIPNSAPMGIIQIGIFHARNFLASFLKAKPGTGSSGFIKVFLELGTSLLIVFVTYVSSRG